MCVRETETQRDIETERQRDRVCVCRDTVRQCVCAEIHQDSERAREKYLEGVVEERQTVCARDRETERQRETGI